jgi:hypothetical protein
MAHKKRISPPSEEPRIFSINGNLALRK